MNIELTSILILLASYSALSLTSTIVGARKNKKISDMSWDWKVWLSGATNYALYGVVALVIAGAIWAILYVAGLNDTDIAGMDIKTTVVLPLLAANVGMVGSLSKKWATMIGVSQEVIDQLRAGEKVEIEGIGIETKTDGKTSKELIAEVDPDLAEEGELILDYPGRGDANTYPEPYRSAPQDSLVDPSTCYNRQCVSYAAWKICEAVGAWLRRTGDMHAKNWIYRLPENGYNKVDRPINGGKYVGVSTVGTYGHVLWFESDNRISEYNWAYVGGYDQRNINLTDYHWYQIVAPPVISEAQPATAPVPTPTTEPDNSVQIGNRVTTTDAYDVQTGGRLNLTIINDGKSVYAGQNTRGNAVLAYQVPSGVVRAAVNYGSLRKI